MNLFFAQITYIYTRTLSLSRTLSLLLSLTLFVSLSLSSTLQRQLSDSVAGILYWLNLHLVHQDGGITHHIVHYSFIFEKNWKWEMGTITLVTDYRKFSSISNRLPDNYPLYKTRCLLMRMTIFQRH